MKNKISIICILILILSGCSTHSANNLPQGDDPVSWINFEGKKYEFYKTNVSVDDFLISTNEKTDADDGVESNLEIFKAESENGVNLFIQDPISKEWVEYRLK